MNRYRLKKKYPVLDISELVDAAGLEAYKTGDIADLVSYVLPAYRPEEIGTILRASFRVIKLLLMKYHKEVRMSPLCLFKATKYHEDSQRWSYDLIPMLTPSDVYGKGYTMDSSSKEDFTMTDKEAAGVE